MRILHLAEREHWVAAQRTGFYRRSTRGLAVDQVGFVHASTAAQLPDVITNFYHDAHLAQFVLLVIDVGACTAQGSPVRWDVVGDSVFPHIYGPLPVTAVVAVLDLGQDGAGAPVIPDLTALDVAGGQPN